MSRLARQEQASVRGTRFDVKRPLGEGGLGVVYEAYDRVRDARVALKTLRQPSPEAITRLKREFRALENLQHPNLVTLHELFEEDGEWFFTMELVEGTDFLEFVREGLADNDQGVLADEGRLRKAFVQLASALSALHGAGKIHRDVKPSNVLVTAEGRVVLLDFGLVTDIDKEPDWTSVNAVGTARYMAPEQAAGRPVGPEADWYAVGAMLYEALTGAAPFQGAALNVLLDKQRVVPAAPSTLFPQLPADLSALCMDMLRIDAARRPASASVIERVRGAVAPDGRLLISLPPEPSQDITGTLTITQQRNAPFLGREAELAFLESALAEVRRGEQRSVYVEGESGIGKSELIRAFTSRAAGEKVIHLRGRCYEREAVAYKAVDGVMEDLSQVMRRMPQREAALLIPRRAGLLQRVFPALTRVEMLAGTPGPQAADPMELRAQLFEAFRELFVRLSEQRTIIVTIDDLQWSDSESLALLSELLRKPGAPPLLFIASWRSAHAGEVAGIGLDALPRDARTLSLGRLAPATARELARNLLQQAGADPRRAEQVAEEAGGHPILIDELARFTSQARPGAAVGRVEDALWARIEKLDPAVRGVLELYAIGSGRLAPGVVTRASRLSAGELSRHIAALRVLRLLRTARGGDTAEIYHDSVRRAVLAHLDEGAQRRLHGELARALRASGKEDWEQLAVHHHGAGDHEQAVVYMLRGAEQAGQALAFGHAARLYERTLALWPADHPERRAVQIRMGDALANDGRGLEAARAYIAASEGAESAQALELTRLAAQQFLLTGHVDEGFARLDQVLASEGIKLPSTPGKALLSVAYSRFMLRLRGFDFVRLDQSRVPRSQRSRADLCLRSALPLAMYDPVRGQSLGLRGVFEAMRTGDAATICTALCVYSGYLAGDGSSAEAATDRLLDTAHALATEAESPHALGFVLGARGQARYFCGRFRAAVQFCAESERVLRERCLGVPFELDTVRLWTMRALLYLGEYGELAARLPAMLEECHQRQDLYGEVSLRASLQPNILLACDQSEQALVDLAATEKLWSVAGYHVQHFYFAVGNASVAMYQGRHADALGIAAKLRADVERSVLRRIQNIRVTVDALLGRTQLAVLRERTDVAALRKAEAVAARLTREKVGWATPQAELLRAGVAQLRKRPDDAVARLRAALAGFEATEMRLYAACTRIRLGALIGGEEGVALRTQGQAVMSMQRIAVPARMLDLLAPGFDP